MQKGEARPWLQLMTLAIGGIEAQNCTHLRMEGVTEAEWHGLKLSWPGLGRLRLQLILASVSVDRHRLLFSAGG